MTSWWNVIQRLNPLDYGRDTRAWNRAKVMGVVSTFQAIADVYGETVALKLMQDISAEAVLNRLNSDKTADNITIRED